MELTVGQIERLKPAVGFALRVLWDRVAPEIDGSRSLDPYHEESRYWYALADFYESLGGDVAARMAAGMNFEKDADQGEFGR